MSAESAPGQPFEFWRQPGPDGGIGITGSMIIGEVTVYQQGFTIGQQLNTLEFRYGENSTTSLIPTGVPWHPPTRTHAERLRVTSASPNTITVRVCGVWG